MFDDQRLDSYYDWLLWTLAQNLLVTALMIPVVWLLCWGFRTRPAVQHLLWLIVLIKFVTPPLPGLAWQLPEFTQSKGVKQPAELEPIDAETLMAASIEFEHAFPDQTQFVLELPSEHPTPNSEAAVDAPYFDPYLLMLMVWGAGAAVLATIQLRKTLRCYRLVRRGSDATALLSRVVARTSKRMGLRRLDTRVVSRIASPFLCCVGRVQLAWPQSLLSLDEASIAVITAHESAHLRRKDHWVAWIELAASIAWWWNPLFWFVRRQLRNAAELSCDAMALEAYPEDRCLYAETLLWLSAGIKAGAPPLQLAIGSGAPSSIERRIYMIATDHVSGKLSISGALLASLLVLGTLPGWSIAQTELGVESQATYEEGSGSGLTATIGFVQADEQLIDGTPPLVTQGGGAPAPTLGEFVVQATGSAGGAPGSSSTTATAGMSGGGAPATGTMPSSAPSTNGQSQAASSLAQQLLRIKAMQLLALAENRTADAEALATAIRILEANPEIAGKLDQVNLIYSTEELHSSSAPASRLTLDKKLYRTGLYTNSSSSLGFLRGFNSLALRRKITGSNVGTVWGAGIYTDDSPVAAAAVHAGLVKFGETKDIVLIVEPGQEKYFGAERNGITTADYGSWPGSYRLTSVEETPDAIFMCNRGDDNTTNLHLESLKDQAPIKPGTILIVPLMGSTTGVVWGSGIYTADSSLDAAAVHAGLLTQGQAGLCKITILEGRKSYAGTTANGIKSTSYGEWGMSFQIEALPKADVRQPPVMGLQ